VASITIGSASRHLGQLATTLGRLDEAADHFEAALEMNGRTGARPWLGLTATDYARMLRARGAGGDRERADELTAHALELASQHGLAIVEQHARGG
jgi:tetratricopeptide (TPR) repeat protein